MIDSSVNTVPALLESLHEWDGGLPVIALGELDLGNMDDEVLAKKIIARLDAEPQYNKFMDTLYRAQVYRDQYAAHRGRSQQREILLFRSLVGTSRTVQRVRNDGPGCG